MFERDQLLTEFDEIVRQRAESAEQIDRVLQQVSDDKHREQLLAMRDHTSRHVELTERLMEILD